MKENITFDKSKAKKFFLSEISFKISPFELHKIIKDNVDLINIVDVRTYEEYIDGHIPFAIHVPLEHICEHYVLFEKEKINIIYCCSDLCQKASKASYNLACEGYPVKVLIGGVSSWKAQNYDIVRTSAENM